MKKLFFPCVALLAAPALVVFVACSDDASTSAPASSNDGGSAVVGDGGSAADPNSFGPPSHETGDSWVMKEIQRVETANVSPQTSTRQYTTIVDIGGDRGAFGGHYVFDDSANTTPFVVNADGLITSRNGCDLKPADNTIQFPLAAGARWSVDYVNCNGNHTTGTGEVVDRETIQTALGALDTFKIQTQTNDAVAANPDAGLGTTMTSYWSTRYGIVVKASSVQPDATGTTTTTSEIVSFTPAK